MPRYLAAADIMAMNDAIVSRAGGGTSVVRDGGALESAVMRPQMAAHNEAADLVAQAAPLMAGIALAHAFLDGNKRTAIAAGATFLYLNGFMIASESPALGRQIEALVVRSATIQDALAELTDWLREHIRPLE